MKNKIVRASLIALAFLIIVISVYYYIDYRNNYKIDSPQLNYENNQNYNQVGSNGGIISSGIGSPVQFTLEVLNFDIESVENEVPYAKVNTGDRVIMKLTFLSSEDINVARLQPWLYRVGVEPITERITEGLPSEVNNVKRLQNYEYEFTLTIPENPKDARYAFAVFMSGCSSSGCGAGGQIDFIVGNDEAPAPPGNIAIAE